MSVRNVLSNNFTAVLVQGNVFKSRVERVAVDVSGKNVVIVGVALFNVLNTLERSGEAKVGLVNRRLGASVDEQVVDKATQNTSNGRSNDRNPKVSAVGSENLVAISNNVRCETRTKVTGRVHGITSLPTETGTKSENEEAETEGSKRASGNIVGVVEGENAHHKKGRGNDFRKDGTNTDHKVCRVCAKDTTGGGATKNSSNSVTFVVVKSRSVVTVNDKGSAKGTKELGKSIDGELLPREATVNTVRKSDTRIKMATRDTTGNIDTKHDSNTPAPGDGLVGAVGTIGKNDLGYDTVTKHDHDKSSQEFGNGLTEHVPYSRPSRQSLLGLCVDDFFRHGS